MIIRILISFFCLALFSCQKDPEPAFIGFELEIKDEEPFGNIMWFEIHSHNRIPDSDLQFFIEEQEVIPQKLATGEWEVNIVDFDPGVLSLKVCLRSNKKNIRQTNFKKAEYLLDLMVDESFLSNETKHFVILWDQNGNQFYNNEIKASGSHKVPLGNTLLRKISIGIFTKVEDFGQGLGQIFTQVPIGKTWPLKVQEALRNEFGTANLLLRNIPQHDEYWISSKGSFSHGQMLKNNHPVFLDFIPSRFFVKLHQDSKIFGKFFPQESKFAGQTLEIDLGELQELEPLQLNFNKSVIGSYSIYGFENPQNLCTQYPLAIGGLQDQIKIGISDYSAFFPFVEFQLNYQQEDALVFSRFRGEDFPSFFTVYESGISLEEVGEGKFNLDIRGEIDLLFSTWKGHDEFGVNWFVFVVQSPEENLLAAPLLANNTLSIKNLELNSLIIENSDFLEDYTEFLEFFSLGISKDYDRKARIFHSKMMPFSNFGLNIEFNKEEINRYLLFNNYHL
ncbi:hypothetical protein [Shivajiella indica]|uniref:Lipoprotein n=1 Tax=Shivajiella indica TaxID=872115 RepID=A0ABW5B9S7_9BACT